WPTHSSGVLSSHHTSKKDQGLLLRLVLCSRKRQLRVSAIAQNLLLATAYSDPEPIFEDTGANILGSAVTGFLPNPFVAGIDRRAHFLPAKTFLLEIGFVF
ncbi:MAG TPA: hypothetical protein PKA00_11075, partial [Saprospiraceae bacterium]|nr:hypothetical protein [Saprospiraceae bacterium]HMQ83444.1 hypothetical protein [Saprospiraceae bacterium]